MQPNSSSPVVNIITFTIKAAIVFTLFLVAIVFLLPDFPALSFSIKKAARDEKIRVTLLSFIQNPAALYRDSEIDEKNGKLESAVMEMQMAIGLLEMHSANQSVIRRYASRLEKLELLLKAAKKLEPAAEPSSVMFNGKLIKRWKE